MYYICTLICINLSHVSVSQIHKCKSHTVFSGREFKHVILTLLDYTLYVYSGVCERELLSFLQCFSNE